MSKSFDIANASVALERFTRKLEREHPAVNSPLLVERDWRWNFLVDEAVNQLVQERKMAQPTKAELSEAHKRLVRERMCYLADLYVPIWEGHR